MKTARHQFGDVSGQFSGLNVINIKTSLFTIPGLFGDAHQLVPREYFEPAPLALRNSSAEGAIPMLIFAGELAAPETD